MGKQSRRKQVGLKTRRPSCLNFRFDQSSEWATLRISAADATEFLHRATTLMTETPIWPTLVWVQNEFLLPRIRQRDWSRVSPADLLDALHKVGNIHQGIREFLPLPYRQCPLEVRRALYLSAFVMAGDAAIEANPHETFDLPEFAHWPPRARVIFAAMKPLWYMLAQPAITATVQHRLLASQEADAAVLALLHEASRHDDPQLGGEGERLWLPLLGTDDKKLLEYMAARFKKRSRDYVTGNETGDVTSELMFGLDKVQGDRTAAEFMADILAGNSDGYAATVETNLREANTEESYYHQFKIRLRRGAEAPEPRAPFALTESQVEALHLPNRLRRLLMLLRQNPTQSDKALAHQLKKSPQTIHIWRTQLLTFLQRALPQQSS